MVDVDMADEPATLPAPNKAHSPTEDLLGNSPNRPSIGANPSHQPAIENGPEQHTPPIKQHLSKDKVNHAESQWRGRRSDDRVWRELELTLIKLGCPLPDSMSHNAQHLRKAPKRSIGLGSLQINWLFIEIVKIIEQRGDIEDVVRTAIDNLKQEYDLSACHFRWGSEQLWRGAWSWPEERFNELLTEEDHAKGVKIQQDREKKQAELKQQQEQQSPLPQRKQRQRQRTRLASGL